MFTREGHEGSVLTCERLQVNKRNEEVFRASKKAFMSVLYGQRQLFEYLFLDSDHMTKTRLSSSCHEFII